MNPLLEPRPMTPEQIRDLVARARANSTKAREVGKRWLVVARLALREKHLRSSTGGQ